MSAPPLRHRPPPGMDADMLRRALAFTFPEAPPLGDAEFAMVYRSLDSMQRGYVTLSTFTSVFTPRRADVEKRERARGGGVHAYQALPTWAETVGGYIGDWYLGEDDRERLRKAGVVAAGQFEGPDIGVLARGVAGGFGLGHVWDVEERLGHQLGHAELDALGILKWNLGADRYLPDVKRPSGGGKKKAKDPEVEKARRKAGIEKERNVQRMRRQVAARRIQRFYRIVYQEAVDKWNILAGKSATTLQAAARRRKEERAFARAMDAARSVQRFVRRLGALRVVRELRQQRRERQMGEAATVLQASSRRWSQVRAYKVLLEEAREAAERARMAALWAARNEACSMIQACYRKRHFRKVVACWRIQRSFRAHLCRRLLKSLREVSRLKNMMPKG